MTNEFNYRGRFFFSTQGYIKIPLGIIYVKNLNNSCRGTVFEVRNKNRRAKI
jgi:hypothetical protein